MLTPPQLRPPKHPKFDAIHRALLTGLLSNIGNKGDAHEYAGARGIRFNIFPGSGLFEKKPKWLMASELVETTRLYARTCAEAQPRWIELAAGHLVERTYSEPHWDAKTQSIIAFERVTLYGLVLAAQRPAHYGPINPKISRDLFIHHALVLEELRTDAPFFKHNKALVAEVRGLEAKVRAHNLLADVSTRFAFFDARVPAGIATGAQFEAWRKEIERQGKGRLLFMNKEDLLRADAPEITPVNYPDKEEAFGMRLPLDYKYEPGQNNDGITLTVPIAALAQLRPEKYEWLVPGMLEEKVTALMRGLPGALRRNFVPVPEFARAACKNLAGKEHDELGLAEALARELARMTGAEIKPADFFSGKTNDALPDFLRMAFRIVDDAGKTVALSRDLPALQKKLARESSHAFAQLPTQEFNRAGIVTWDFGDLPDVVRVQRFKMMIDAYPAVVEEPAGPHEPAAVALRLFPNGAAAMDHHRAGVRRLFMIEQRREIRSMLAYVQGGQGAAGELDRMALFFRAMGTKEQLRDQLIARIVDRALQLDGSPIRTKAQWEARRAVAVEKLIERGDNIVSLAKNILRLRHDISLKLEEAGAAWPLSLADIHDQLVDLMPPGFLVMTPFRWFEEFPRYLRGILSRLEKLTNGNYQRDTAHTHQLAPWWSAYVARLEQHRAAGVHDPEIEVFRWMLEEFRIHLFAQELGTAVSISPQRLEKQWAKVRA